MVLLFVSRFLYLKITICSRVDSLTSSCQYYMDKPRLSLRASPGVSLVGCVTLNVTSLPVLLSVHVPFKFVLSYLKILAFASFRRSRKGVPPVRASGQNVGTLARSQIPSIYMTGRASTSWTGPLPSKSERKLPLGMIAGPPVGITLRRTHHHSHRAAPGPLRSLPLLIRHDHSCFDVSTWLSPADVSCCL